MPRIPSPINWLRQRNHPDDLLMTYSETKGWDYSGETKRYIEDKEYSQIMGPDAVKDFLDNLVGVWLDSLELKMVDIGNREVEALKEQGLPIPAKVERFVPQWNNGEIAIFFRGLDPNSSDDDGAIKLGRLMPDADLDVVRSKMWEIIDEHLTPPIQVNSITIYQDNSTSKVLFRPLNPINLDEMFGLE